MEKLTDTKIGMIADSLSSFYTLAWQAKCATYSQNKDLRHIFKSQENRPTSSLIDTICLSGRLKDAKRDPNTTPLQLTDNEAHKFVLQMLRGIEAKRKK